MALFPGDVIIKTAIELGLEDLKNNDWLIEDIFSEFIENPFLREKYGMKEIDRAKEFIKNNKVHIFMAHRLDKEQFPCITIALGDSIEDKNLATLADQSTCVTEMDPSEIDRPIPWIVKPFEIVEYDEVTGVAKLPPKLTGFQYVNKGMLLVDVATGDGYEISGVKGKSSIQIAAGLDLSGQKYAIAPRYRSFRVRRERIISQETYNIGCHTHGDPATLLFLFAFTKYALLRYREGLLEASNFQLSNLSCTDMIANRAFQAENVYSRFITLSGQAEESWAKTPYRRIEAVEINTGEEGSELTGINIISNLDTDENSEEADNDLWGTIKEP